MSSLLAEQLAFLQEAPETLKATATGISTLSISQIPLGSLEKQWIQAIIGDIVGRKLQVLYGD